MEMLNTRMVYNSYIKWLANEWTTLNHKNPLDGISKRLFEQKEAEWLEKLRRAYAVDTNSSNILNLEDFHQLIAFGMTHEKS